MLVLEGLGEGGEGAGGGVGEEGGGDLQRQRQPRAQLSDLPGRVRLLVHPDVGAAAGVPERPAEQIDRSCLVEDVQVVQAGAQGEVVARGNQRRGGTVGRQQRARLFSSGGVVDDDQDVSTVKQFPTICMIGVSQFPTPVVTTPHGDADRRWCR
ncbi:hypothetical protein O1G22_42870 [Streptomyces camelliae]|uniref:Uncharacterized protein n=1 Tax=Streptomyces camelliae TaxID=3004093 RepID=A0ABY7PFT0_9ACTN|nr:hypothetical protein [Streptomyces sp. HUAS 2-6]WBO69030.1 hypothetical protein O1G22_42870 [Streptomyces sp. HUAS 2-6]